MTDFEWKDAFDTGHGKIDEQHRRMFMLAVAVVESRFANASNMIGVGLEPLNALIEFTKEHFAFEEALMQSTGYPGIVWHAKFHASLLTELRTFSRKVQQGGIPDADALIKFFRIWVHEHIDTADRELVDWLGKLI